ncbi:MAG: hypothetical protein AAF922_15645 [Pseudomonadota bacterium]
MLYSLAVVDTMGGVTIASPAWDNLSIIQSIDEANYSLHVLFAGESVTLSHQEGTAGHNVFLNIRIGLKSTDEAGLAEAHAHQDGFSIEAASSAPCGPITIDE